MAERERDLGDLGAIWRGGGQTATWKGRGGEQAGRGEKEWTWPHLVVTHAAVQGSRDRTVPTAQPRRTSEQRFDGI